LDISDLESLKNKSVNINVEFPTEEYSQIRNEKTVTDIINSFKKKHENLVGEENNLKERLESEVKRQKDQLESYLSQTNYQIKLNERIKKGVEKIKKEEKNMILTLFYVSLINKSNIQMKSLLDISMKTINFYYKENENNVIIEEFFF